MGAGFGSARSISAAMMSVRDACRFGVCDNVLFRICVLCIWALRLLSYPLF